MNDWQRKMSFVCELLITQIKVPGANCQPNLNFESNQTNTCDT